MLPIIGSLAIYYNRQQYVNINDEESDMANVVCGVPQGSIIGPKLFILYINDICNTSSLLKFILFAQYLNELSRHMSNELVKLSIWFAINKLSLNVAKTNFMVFNLLITLKHRMLLYI